LDRDELRAATVVANHEKTILLALHKKEYKDILYVSLSSPHLYSMFKCSKNQKGRLFYNRFPILNSGALSSS
jgi:hypothetical protein